MRQIAEWLEKPASPRKLLAMPIFLTAAPIISFSRHSVAFGIALGVMSVSYAVIAFRSRKRTNAHDELKGPGEFGDPNP